MNARTVNKVWTGIFYAVAALVVALLVFLVFEILQKGWGFWDPNFLFGEPSNTRAGGGIGPQLFNSFYMLVITLIISIPLGLGAGIYLAEYAKQGRFLNFVRLCIETMASLPSIVVGLFGLLVFVTMTGWGYTVMGGALALTILNLPGLTRVCENAISEVPSNVKEASLGLGATKWQTITRIIIPSSLPQIITGVILAAGRIFGEAAALIYTAGLTSPILNSAADFSSPAHPLNPFRPAETLAVHIWKLNSEGIIPDSEVNCDKVCSCINYYGIAIQCYFTLSSIYIAQTFYRSEKKK